MSDPPDWLPPLVLLEDYGGDWSAFLDAVYQYFWEDFVDTRPEYAGKRLALKRHPMLQGREATFWHLISEGRVEASRLPDLRRCERIRWPKPMIEQEKRRRLPTWVTKRHGERRIVIALHDFSYVVVLADRGNYILLWTAYCVEREHHRRKLQRECEEANRTRNG